MPPEVLHEKVHQQPFRPFRMHLRDGTAYEVRHPDLVMVGKRYLVLGLVKDPLKTLFERTVEVDLLHIIRTEDLEPATSKDGAS